MANFENKAKGIYSVAKIPADIQYGFGGKGTFAAIEEGKRALIWQAAKLDYKNISNNGNLLSVNTVNLDQGDMDKVNDVLKKLSDAKLRKLSDTRG